MSSEEEQQLQLVIKVQPNVNLDAVSISCLEFKEAEVSELIGKKIHSEEAAYELYNDYSFKFGFGIRRHNLRLWNNGDIKGREFVCYKEGFKKRKNDQDNKQFTKLDVRCGCKARVYFEKSKDGVWTALSHNLVHNHSMCSPDSVHLIRSHRGVSESKKDLLLRLVAAGVKPADAIRFVKLDSGGSPLLGFKARDAYNELAKEKGKNLDGTDANTLIGYFRSRKANEEDFFFDFEIDHDSSLVSFFWRDKRMKDNYSQFGDLFVFDTTFRTNKYDMICAPFVGINNHTHNCMFACGFLLNERKESFIWLFNAFLRSMDGKHPKTVMTDQDFAMAFALSTVFPSSIHRLCTWHILQNSRSNIKSLRSQDGFLPLFNHFVMYCDTTTEFDHCWKRLKENYDVERSEWMKRLYNLHEKWASAFSKDVFSGGVLSSQRSETTNNSVSRKICKTASLCDFYNKFCEVVSEWRSHEKQDDQRCWEGLPERAFDMPILSHAARVFTIDAYKLLENQFRLCITCNQNMKCSNGSQMWFHVWKPKDNFAHFVSFELGSNRIFCTCKKFEEMGILCCHALRIYMIYGVPLISDAYILKRWTRGAKPIDEQDKAEHVVDAKEPVLSGSVWRTLMKRKFYTLISACEPNKNARVRCEELFAKGKVEIETEVGSVYFSDDEQAQDDGRGHVILNPKGLRKKGERNVRKKSVLEKKASLARRRGNITAKCNSLKTVSPHASPQVNQVASRHTSPMVVILFPGSFMWQLNAPTLVILSPKDLIRT